MTELLFQDESYLKEFEATITEMVEGGAVLDRSAFYIGGGGQPCDTGVLLPGRHAPIVTQLGRKEGKIVHQIQDLEATTLISGLTAGQTVTGRIEWEQRFLLMRTHTALHILCGGVVRDLGVKCPAGVTPPGERGRGGLHHKVFRQKAEGRHGLDPPFGCGTSNDRVDEADAI